MGELLEKTLFILSNVISNSKSTTTIIKLYFIRQYVKSNYVNSLLVFKELRTIKLYCLLNQFLKVIKLFKKIN